MCTKRRSRVDIFHSGGVYKIIHPVLVKIGIPWSIWTFFPLLLDQKLIMNWKFEQALETMIHSGLNSCPYIIIKIYLIWGKNDNFRQKHSWIEDKFFIFVRTLYSWNGCCINHSKSLKMFPKKVKRPKSKLYKTERDRHKSYAKIGIKSN